MRVKRILSDEVGIYPSEKFERFCGKDVIEKLMKLPFVLKNGKPISQRRVNFSIGDTDYHVLKSKSSDFQFCFHVYEHLK